MKRFFLSLSLILLLCQGMVTAQNFALSGTWLRHPSFYQTPERFIEGNKNTYFLLHQQHYNTAYDDYKKNTATLFRLDKTNSEEKIEALSNKYPFFPSAIRTFTYSPSNSLAIAAAEDFSIWIIPDEGTPYNAGELISKILPGNHHINSITESSDGKFWIGATFGYAVFDPAQRKIVKSISTDYNVEHIASFGDRLVIFSGENAYETDLNSTAANLSKLSLVSTQGDSSSGLMKGNSLDAPEIIMPLSEKSFAFLGPESGGRVLGIATKNGNDWSVIALDKPVLTEIDINQNITSPLAINCTPTGSGYLLQTSDALYQLKKGIDPVQGETTEQFKSKVLSSAAKGEEKDKLAATFDFSEFRFFSPKEGFYTRNISGDSWTSSSSKIYPEAPLAFISTFMKWHPSLGLIVSNHAYDWIFADSAPSTPWLISGFKGGKWTPLSPVFYPHEEFNTAELKNFYNSKIEQYPVNFPDGLAISQTDPKYAYAGSQTGGWTRINLENPAELPLHIGNSVNTFINTPGFIEGAITSESWKYVCDYSAPEFDLDGRLWFLYMDNDKRQTPERTVTLYWYEPEELKAMESAATNNAAYKAPHLLEFPTETMMQPKQQFLVLRHEKNRNIVAFEMGTFGAPLYLYDHNGTPDNTADDRIAIIERPKDALDGTVIDVSTAAKIWEDPATGKIWYSHYHGTFSIDPSLAFEDPSKACELLRIDSNNDGVADRKLFQTALVVDGDVDAEGNLWVATNGSGLWCLSPDRKSVIGEMNVTNSQILSNQLFSVCVNPERKSVMVSTAEGLAEFFPDMMGATDNERISMSPTSITPLFRGLVTFSGLPQDSYIITDTQGNEVINIGKPERGLIQWDATTSDNKRLPTGTYFLKSSSGKNVSLEFHVLN